MRSTVELKVLLLNSKFELKFNNITSYKKRPSDLKSDGLFDNRPTDVIGEEVYNMQLSKEHADYIQNTKSVNHVTYFRNYVTLSARLIINFAQ